MVERGNGTEPVQKNESILSRDFVEYVLQGARENLNIHSSLNATIFVRLDQNDRLIIPLSMPQTHEEKQLYFAYIGLGIRTEGRTIQEAILVSESWIVETPDGSYPSQTPVSEHPSRREAITLVGRDSPGKRFVFAIQPFQRDPDNHPIFDEPELQDFNETPDGKYYSTGLLDYLFLPIKNNVH